MPVPTVLPNNELDLLSRPNACLWAGYSRVHLIPLGGRHQLLEKWARRVNKIYGWRFHSLINFKWFLDDTFKQSTNEIREYYFRTLLTVRHDKGLTVGMPCGLLTKYTLDTWLCLSQQKTIIEQPLPNLWANRKPNVCLETFQLGSRIKFRNMMIYISNR